MKTYLAPLNKLGNSAFRELVINNGVNYVFSEMIRCEKLLENDEVQIRKSTIPMKLQPKTILQIICEDNLNNIPKTIQKLKTLNPKIKEINYNMGCPQSSLCKNFNGAGILKNPEKIKKVCKIFSKVCKSNNITPSIKTRIGISRENITILEILKIIQDSGINKVYIHGRTLGEPYSKPATYDEIIEAKNKYPNLEIIVNGDINNLKTYNKLLKTKLDGIMIGRSALEYPDIFNKLKNQTFKINKSGENILDKKKIILQFLELAQKYNLSDSQIKANLSYLTKGCTNGAKIRKEINIITNIEELQNYIKENI